MIAALLLVLASPDRVVSVEEPGAGWVTLAVRAEGGLERRATFAGGAAAERWLARTVAEPGSCGAWVVGLTGAVDGLAGAIERVLAGRPARPCPRPRTGARVVVRPSAASPSVRLELGPTGTACAAPLEAAWSGRRAAPLARAFREETGLELHSRASLRAGVELGFAAREGSIERDLARLVSLIASVGVTPDDVARGRSRASGELAIDLAAPWTRLARAMDLAAVGRAPTELERLVAEQAACPPASLAAALEELRRRPPRVEVHGELDPRAIAALAGLEALGGVEILP